MTEPLPRGWALVPDESTRWSDDGGCLYGGSPWRLLRLTGNGSALARRLLGGAPVDDASAAALGRRLVDAGLAHPVPPADVDVADIDVVVPAYGRTEQLDHCLNELGTRHPILVVDDGSPDERGIADVAQRRGARLQRVADNRGPAAARNTGAAVTDAPVIAFVDSDAAVDAFTLTGLARHLTDPSVGAVAPRILPTGGETTVLARFAAAASPLDLGARPGSVRPHHRVPYVPSTVLLVRRAAFEAIGGFDEALRYGEDVDLVWRLVDAGWTVRYDPAYVARHHEPAAWRDWSRRRFHYGASAGPLALRHGSRLAGPPLRVLAAPFTVRRTTQGVLPPDAARDVARIASRDAATGLVRWTGPLLAPPLLAAALLRRSLPLAAVASGVAAAAGMLDAARRAGHPPPLPLARAAAVDGLAYGAGVWWGALRAGTAVPLLPRADAAAGDDTAAGALSS